MALPAALLAQLRAMAAVPQLGLFSDIDGTLSPIAATPAAARVDPACRTALAGLAVELPLVAAVTGRAPLDARAMLDLETVVYVGNHGLERWAAGAVEPLPAVLPFVPLVARVLEELVRFPLPEWVILENKGATASVHYRLAPDPVAARTLLGGWLAPLCAAAGLRLMPGRMIFEIRPPLALNKGTAIASLLRERKLAAALFLGDDVTDVDGFMALAAARVAGVTTLSIGVLSAETPAAVREASDVQVDGVAGVAQVLNALLRFRKAI